MKEAIEIDQIGTRGRIVIPSGIRKKFGLKKGDNVLFKTQGKNIILTQVNSNSIKVQSSKTIIQRLLEILRLK